jgi:hypothetical protein
MVAFSDNKVKVFTVSDNDGVYVSGTINWLAIQNMTKYKWSDISNF